ncbi:MAG: glycyl-radical enzyme activating protein [Clostridia bacterium]|nr:glycyl-radical enzyme activating protein [Clostridia bacterium]
MTGLISGIKRMEIHDGDGCRTTVFFKGCPLRCLWCHNPESISFAPQVAFFREKCMGCSLCVGQRTEKTAENCPTCAQIFYGRTVEAEALVSELAQDEDYFRNSGGGVTLSGGECLMQGDFAVEVARLLKERGISVFVDTCGYVKREILERIVPYTDRFLYDIKAIDPAVHRRCTGRENGLILENLAFLSERGCDVEIRYPLVKDYNDGECDKIGAFLQGMKGISKIKVLQYHSFAASRYEALGMENTLPRVVTTPQDVAQAVEILQSYGLPAVNGISED